MLERAQIFPVPVLICVLKNIFKIRSKLVRIVSYVLVLRWTIQVRIS
jgi:hypothetical protein